MVAPQLIEELSDGKFHSGESLSTKLGVSRTAIWKQIKKIERDWGLNVYAVRGKGYRLPESLDLLDESIVLDRLNETVKKRIDQLEIFSEIDSTNRYLMEKALSGCAGVRVSLAERQTAGKGRRGRRWISPFGKNIYLSILWQSQKPPHQLAGLSLAMGTVVAELLQSLGFTQPALKWPNDIVTTKGKLAGLLMQVSGEGQGPSHVVAGLGLNVAMPIDAANDIDQAWVDLKSMGEVPKRSELAASLINAMLEGLHAYELFGLEPFLNRWRQLDFYRGRKVALIRGKESIVGICMGIADDGSLKLRTSEGIEHFHGGELSLRGCN